MTPRRYELVSQLGVEAAALDPGPRNEFLAQRCADDLSLREEVEEWLRNDQKADEDGFLEDSSPLAGLISLPRPGQLDPMIGRRIGVYEITRKIDSGGMGDVYLAVRRDDIQMRVALKLVKRGTDSQAIHQRFRIEKQILAALRHAHIARFLDGSVTEDGLPYYVMEFIEGKPIDKYCDDHRLNTSQRLVLFRIVCLAVHFAHRFGVIHRDLSPGNILVTDDGTPKLIDFGIAKVINPELSFATDDGPTRTECRFLKPEYASPEQVLGEPVTTASDVYSLGVVLYRLLTGHPPYRFLSSARRDIESTVCEAEPEAPSTVVLRPVKVAGTGDTTRTVTPEEVSKVRDGLPTTLRDRLAGEVDKIVLMALKKEPDRRFTSTEQFAEDIRRHLEGLPLLWAERDTLLYRTRKFIKRNRVLVAAAALVVLSLVGGITGTTLALLRAWGAEAEAKQGQEEAVKEQKNAQRALADLSLQKAFDRCGRGDIGTGLLWLGQALDAAERGEAPALERVIRANLDGWNRQLVALTDCLTPPPEEVFAFNSDGVSAWAVTPDNNVVRRWSLATGEFGGPPLKHPKPVVALAVSPDGSWVGTCCADRSLRLWNAATGRPIREISDKRELAVVGFSSDSRSMVAGRIEQKDRQESTVFEAWELETGKSVPPLFRLPGRIDHFALSPDRRTLLTVTSLERTVRRWEMPTGRPLGTLLPHQGWIHAVAFSPDGQAILTGGDDRVARLWEAVSGRPLEVLYHRNPVCAVAFGTGGRRFLTASPDDAVRIWEGTSSPEPLRTLSHPRSIWALAVSPDGKWIVTGADDSILRFWESTSGKRIPSMDLPHAGPPLFAAFSPNGGLLITTMYQRFDAPRHEALLWKCFPGGLLPVQKRAVLSHRGRIGRIAFNQDGTRVATASDDGTARVWDTATGLPAFDCVLAHKGAVLAVAFRFDGRKVLTGGADGVARCWDTATGAPFGPALTHGRDVVDVACSPDGRMILTAGKDGLVRRWDAGTGAQQEPSLDYGGSEVGAVAMSPPEGRTILTRSLDTARLWDAATGQRRGAPLRHAGRIRAMAISPDGQWVVTGSEDSTARVWDSQTGRPLGPALLHDSSAHLVAVGPAGSGWFVTAGLDGVAKRWPAPVLLEAPVSQVVLWAQVRTGVELDAGEDVKVLDAGAWHQRRQRLQEAGGLALP
jgi:WD40 repeat protein/serine/threonine protein kinase